jgi:lipopolysaccharide/colanic/teichoic acid biosynthesis glycosyltransferase
MSVVGYRPLLVADINHAVSRLKPHYLESSPFHPNRWLSLREQAKPGITGFAQTMPPRADSGTLDHLADVVSGECDYLETATFAVDLRYMLVTPRAIRQGHNPTVLREPIRDI